MSNYFVLYPNEIFIHNHPLCLNIEEIYLYAYLHMHRNFHTERVLTNIGLLNATIKLIAKKQSNIKRIIMALLGLHQKGYIDIASDIGICDEEYIRKTEVLDIGVKTKHDHEHGYNEMRYETFDQVENPLQYAILTYIHSVSWRKRQIPYSEFSSALVNYNGKLISDKTIRNEIKELEKLGLLYVVRGELYCVNEEEKEWRKAINQYELSDGEYEYTDITEKKPPTGLMAKVIDKEQEARNLINQLPAKLEYKHYKWIMDYGVWNEWVKIFAEKVRFEPMRKAGFDFSWWEERYNKENNNNNNNGE